MNRKDEHLIGALKQDIICNDFDKMDFIHHGLSSISFDEIDLSTTFLGYKIPFPIYINAMTGGSKKALEINEKLSEIASVYQIPIATGSLSPILKDISEIGSYEVVKRKGNTVIGNIGADKNIDDVKYVLNKFNVNGLQIHINQVQEAIMPEGERDFSNYEKNIKDIINEVNLPVVVKEVGFGMSASTFTKLKNLGVKYIDVGGSGGTNFASIENSRRNKEFSTLNNWGLSTVKSLLEASKVEGIEVYASGGVRNAMDIVKSLSLGAKAVGMAGYFLKLVSEKDIKEILDEVDNLLLEVKTIMFILGVKNVYELRNTEIVFNEDIINFINQRNIKKDILAYR